MFSVAGGYMDILRNLKINVRNPILVIGIESSPASLSEFNHIALSKSAECTYYKAEAETIQ